MADKPTHSELIAKSKRLIRASCQLKEKPDNFIEHSFPIRRTKAPRPDMSNNDEYVREHTCANGAHFTTKKWQAPMNQHPEVLNSWKEIAVYLNRGVRTVQRWEHDLQLPVRRPRQKARSAVIAFRSELDQWLANAGSNYRLGSDCAGAVLDLPSLERRLQRLQVEMQNIQNQIRHIKENASDKLENDDWIDEGLTAA